MMMNGNDPGNKAGNPKKRVWIWLLIFAVAFAVFYIAVPYYRLQEADRFCMEGESSYAAELYSKYTTNLFWKTRAAEGYNAAINDVAETAVADHDYDLAIEIYSELGNSEKVSETRLASAEYSFSEGDYQKAAMIFEEMDNTARAHDSWEKYGDVSLESNDFEQAVTAYTNAQNESKIQAVHLSWAENLAAGDEFDEAAQHFILAGREDKAREIMIEKAKRMIADQNVDGILDVLNPYTGSDIAELLFQAQKIGFEDISSEDAVNNAGKFGETVRDPDTQLYYCHKLLENGYDLKKVYPDGVFVDMNLSPCQFYNSGQKDSPAPDTSKIIVFSRHDRVPDLEVRTTTSSAAVESAVDDEWKNRLNGQYFCSVKLRPDLIIDLPDGYQAWSLEDSTSYIVLDEGYLPCGNISVRTTTQSSLFSSRSSHISYKILLYYAAYNAITVYDRNHPERLINLGTYWDYPVASGAVVGNSYSDSGIDLTGLEIQEIQRALENRESIESLEILARYDPKVIEFVEQNGWGDYILIPDKDENGNQKNVKGTADNLWSWYIPEYMIGHPNETWINENIDDAMAGLSLYLALLSYHTDTEDVEEWEKYTEEITTGSEGITVSFYCHPDWAKDDLSPVSWATEFVNVNEKTTRMGFSVGDIVTNFRIDEEKRSLLNADNFSDSDDFIKGLVAYDCEMDDPTVEYNQSDRSYFVLQSKQFSTEAAYKAVVHLENGYQYTFYLYGTDPETLQQRENEFMRMALSFSINQ